MEFEDPIDTWVATEVDEVVEVLRQGEAAAGRGHWVVGLVAYEAAAAFDGALPRARTRTSPAPLAWMTSFANRTETALVGPPADVPHVESVERLWGSHWYREGVETIRARIALGDVYQVNLTDRLRGTLHADPFDLYRSMVATQGGAFHAYLDLGELVVVSASPELFLCVDSGADLCVATTRPMKGTRPRRGRYDDDVAAADQLLASEKDRAENVMIVDLLRNDLSRVARTGGVSVPSLFDVERYDTVWQLTSTVRAELRDDADLAELFSATFPCGSVTGAPKVAAMRIIDSLEGTARGVYCGAIGYLAPSSPGFRPSSVWSVAIRTAVVDTATGTVEFGAGGGITADSEPDAEDDELEAKTAVLRRPRPAFELFETMRLDGLGVHHVDRHLRRISASAEYFGFAFDAPRAAADLAALRPGPVARRVRLILDRRGNHRVEVLELDVVAAEVRLAVSADPVDSDDPFCCHKTTRRDHYQRALRGHDAADDVVLVNESGEAVETTVANLLYRIGDRWFTPPLRSGGLPGVGRAWLVESGAVSERTVLGVELGGCDQLAVVSSLRGIRSARLGA